MLAAFTLRVSLLGKNRLCCFKLIYFIWSMMVLRTMIELGFILVNSTVLVILRPFSTQTWPWRSVRINLRTDANSLESHCSDTMRKKMINNKCPWLASKLRNFLISFSSLFHFLECPYIVLMFSEWWLC